jgi:tetratricopeptide (TPR) repeat protein
VLYKLAQLRSTRDITLGRPDFRKALALDPSWVPAQNDLLVSYGWNGEHAEATRLAAEWAQRWPSAQTYGVLNGAALWAGDLDAALGAARSAEKLGPGVIAHVGRTLMARGDLAGAEAEFRRLWDRGERLLYDFTLADALFLRGKRREAGRVLDELERSSPEAALVARRTRAFNAAESTDVAEVSSAVRVAEPELIPIERVVLALRLAAAGHVEMAERLADVRGAYGMETHFIEAGRAIVAAARAREQRDLVRARRILEDARARAPFASHRTLDHFIGEACHLANDDRCAVAALSNARAWWGFMAGAATYHRNRYLLAVSLDRLERKAEARTEIEDLLSMLADADADLPVRVQAQELCRRLACRS